MNTSHKTSPDGRGISPAVRFAFALSVATIASACSEPDSPKSSQNPQVCVESGQGAEVAKQIVDSILPIEEHLRKFRLGLTPVDTLKNSSASMRELVNRLAAAISTHDTVALTQMQLSVNEFAYLYYPDSYLSKPPYSAPPELLWGQILASSDNGARRLLKQFGGAPITVSQLSCSNQPDSSGINVLHSYCRVRFSVPGGKSLEGNLFGTIIECNGRFKFLSLANRI